MSDHSRPAGTGPMAAAKSPAGLADAVRDQATGYVERRKSEAAGFLADLAKALRGGTGGPARARRSSRSPMPWPTASTTSRAISTVAARANCIATSRW